MQRQNSPATPATIIILGSRVKELQAGDEYTDKAGCRNVGDYAQCAYVQGNTAATITISGIPFGCTTNLNGVCTKVCYTCTLSLCFAGADRDLFLKHPP